MRRIVDIRMWLEMIGMLHHELLLLLLLLLLLHLLVHQLLLA